MKKNVLKKGLAFVLTLALFVVGFSTVPAKKINANEKAVATWDEFKEALENGETVIRLEEEDTIVATSDIDVTLSEDQVVYVYSPDGKDIISMDYTNFAINVSGQGSIKFENVPFCCYSNPCIVNKDSGNAGIIIRNCGFFNGDGDSIKGDYTVEEITTPDVKKTENKDDAQNDEKDFKPEWKRSWASYGNVDSTAGHLDYVGREIYVSKDGSDDNDGSVDAPLSSLKHAVSVASDGDTIYVNDGKYTIDSSVNIDKSIEIIGEDVILTSYKRYGVMFTVSAANVTISNMKFSRFSGSHQGGVFDIAASATNTSFAECVFENNTARYGGAISCSALNVTIEDCLFNNNTASSYGGAIYCKNSNTSIEINNCNFTNNGAKYYGGVICNYGTVTTGNSCYTNNIARAGGGIYSYGNFISSNDLIYNNMLNATNPSGGTDVYSTKSGTITLPDASTFDATFRDTEIPIDGWYEDSRSNPYDPYSAVRVSTPTESTGSVVAIVAAYADNSNGTFRELFNQISSAEPGGTVSLKRDYCFDEDSDYPDFVNGVVISKPVTIEGNGHIIDGSWAARGLLLQSDSININNATIQNCFASMDNENGSFGAGVAIFGENAIITNCNFTGCMVDGGMDELEEYVSGGDGAAVSCFANGAVFINDTFEYNNAYNDGGAIYLSGNGAYFENNAFISNGAADDGGAIYNTGTNHTFINTEFRENGAAFMSDFANENDIARGGAIYDEHSDGRVSFFNVTFRDNRAADGGAVFSESGGLNVYNNTKFVNNYAEDFEEAEGTSCGGAMRIISGGNYIIDNCMISNNTAMNAGGGIYCEAAGNQETGTPGLTVTDTTLLYNNYAETEASDIYSTGANLTLFDPEFEIGYQETDYPINGWFNDTADDRYEPEVNAQRVDAPQGKTGTYALVAGYGPDKKIEPDIDIDVADISYGQAEFINVTLPQDATGNVTITLNGMDYVTPIEDGVARVTIEGLSARDYTAVATYGGDDRYTNTTADANFTVSKRQTNTTVFAEDIYYNQTEHISFNIYPAVNGTVSVCLNNETTYNVNVVDGSGALEISQLQAGNYTVLVTYAGDENYEGSTATTNFTVNKLNQTVVIDVEKVYVYGDYLLINLTATGDANATLTAFVNDTEVEVNDDLQILLNDYLPGNYTVDVYLADTRNYNAASNTTFFMIKKLRTPINITTETDDSNVVTINATLPGETDDDEVLLANVTGNATLYINGEDTDTQPVVDGAVSFEISGLDPGDYSGILVYNGDEKYDSGNKTFGFNVPESDTCTVYINNETVATLPKDSVYTLPTSGQEYYYEYGYVNDNNQSLVYKPGTNLTVTEDIYLTGIYNVFCEQGQNGASVKMNVNEPGISFAATAYINNGTPIISDGFTYGMLITAYDLFTERLNDELSLDSKGAKVLNITFGGQDFIQFERGRFRAGVLNVTPRNILRSFIARSYVKINYTDGTSRVFYSDDCSLPRSIAECSKKLQQDESYAELSQSAKEAVDTFAAAR